MSAVYESEFDTKPYRAPLNPDFLRRVRQQQRRAAAAQAEVERKAAFEAACLAAEKAAAEAKAAIRAEVEAAERARAADADRMKEAVLAGRKTKYQIIEYRACRVFGVHRSQLHSVRRDNNLANARHFVMYWAIRLTSMSLPQIGRLMGGRDHSTIQYGGQSYIKKRAKMGRHLRAA